MTTSARIETAAIAALAFLAAIAVLTGSGPARLIIVSGFLLVAPGLAITALAGVRDALVRLMLVVPISLAVNASVATAIVYLGLWSADLIFVIVATMTLLCAALAPYERAARGALVGIALLPGLIVLAAEVSIGAPG